MFKKMEEKDSVDLWEVDQIVKLKNEENVIRIPIEGIDLIINRLKIGYNLQKILASLDLIKTKFHTLKHVKITFINFSFPDQENRSEFDQLYEKCLLILRNQLNLEKISIKLKNCSEVEDGHLN